MYKNIVLYKNIPFILFIIATCLFITTETILGWRRIRDLDVTLYYLFFIYRPALIALVLHILKIKFKNKIFQIIIVILNIILIICMGLIVLFDLTVTILLCYDA